jgi:hypothetical protein
MPLLKALVEADRDRIVGLTSFGVSAGEILPSVQIAMTAGLPYTAVGHAILTHPRLVEGLIPAVFIGGICARRDPGGTNKSFGTLNKGTKI